MGGTEGQSKMASNRSGEGGEGRVVPAESKLEDPPPPPPPPPLVALPLLPRLSPVVEGGGGALPRHDRKYAMAAAVAWTPAVAVVVWASVPLPRILGEGEMKTKTSKRQRKCCFKKKRNMRRVVFSSGKSKGC